MKTALITGANRGLGRGFVQYFVDRGYKVFAGTRDPLSMAGELKDNVNLHIVALDVSDDKSVEEAFQAVSKDCDHLDYLINNAGINAASADPSHPESSTRLSTLSRDVLHKMFDVNSISPIMVLKVFSSLLTANPSYVINVSSCRASFHDEYENTRWRSRGYGYRSSKLALNMMTLCTTGDLAETVRTFAVHPGEVRSDMNPNGEHDPVKQASVIIAITENWRPEHQGRFLNYDGKPYPL